MAGNFWSRLTGRQSKPAKTFDGQELKRAMLAAYAWLGEHRDAINALNVFPVPDGDTGTNMLLTMRAAVAEIADANDTAVYVIADKLSRGALMGARGNSGVILSQILRGLSNGFEKKETLTPVDFAAALTLAAQLAYRAVIKPVEGTILTVVRESAEAAQRSAPKAPDMSALLGDIVTAARAAVARTPDLLPILKQAGVVDAGGEGLATIFEGMWRYLRGEAVQLTPRQEREESAEIHHGRVTIDEEYGYEIVFILRGENLNIDEIRDAITAMGGVSTVIAGDSRLIKVHTHTATPGRILDYAIGLGTVTDVTIENLQEQSLRYAEEGARERGETPATPGTGTATAAPPAATTPRPVGEVAIVVVAAGDGWIRVFESLGVAAIVPGGQTMNPSTKDLLDAVQRVPAQKVILLPNNGNVILSARQVPPLTQKEVCVVPSRSLPQGVGAVLAYNFDADFATNCRAMEAALTRVQTIEITRAVRSVQVDGVAVSEGDVIGLVNDKLVASGRDLEAVVRQALSEVGVEKYEIVTIYYGADATEAATRALAARIKEWYPNIETEIVNGGQPYYAYIMSVE
jgi:DAK2 domain fusion protein YloV